jgi:mannose-6-phosphate isomerase-like protein (cupin superfamily)
MAEVKIVPADGGKKFIPGDGEEVYFKVTGDDTDGMFDHFEIRVGHLQGFPLHIHLEQHETFHVIEGELRLQVGERMIDAKAGDFVLIPKGVVHTYVNLKQERARAVGILTPGGFDKFVEEMSAYAASVKGKVDQAKVAEIAAKHKQKQVGPPLAVVLGLVKGPAH